MIWVGAFALPGEAEGSAVVLAEPLSFWGGVDPATGTVIDRSHPACGARLAGRVVVMPGGRGSSSSSSVLAEAIRRGTGPRALLLARPDPILAVGAMVALDLYGLRCPVVVCRPDGAATGDRLRVTATGDAARIERLPSAAGRAAVAWSTRAETTRR